jgi:hypothetical protein
MKPNRHDHSKWFLLIYCIIFTHCILAQSHFLPGFVIDNSGDTLTYLIDFSSDDKCIIQGKQNESVLIKPSEIYGFGFKDNKFYRSHVLTDTFVEVLVEGGSSIYKFKNTYLLEMTDKQSYRFEYLGVVKVTNGDKSYFVEDNKWRGLLKYAMKASPELTDFIDRMTFSEKDFKSAVARYNDFKNLPYHTYKDKLKSIAIHTGLGLGVSLDKMHLDIQNLDYNFPLDFKSLNFLPYLSFEVYSPKEQSKTSLLIETHFKNYSFSSDRKITYTAFDRNVNTKIKFNQLTIPFLLKQQLMDKKIGLSLVGGLNFDFIVHQSSKVTNEDCYCSTPVYKVNRSNDMAYRFRPFQIGYIAGIALTKRLSKRTLGLNIRYHYQIDHSTNTLLGFFSGDNSSKLPSPSFLLNNFIFAFTLSK